MFGHPQHPVGKGPSLPRATTPSLCLTDDFLLLPEASLQWQVFIDKNRAPVRMRAGDNADIGRELRPEDLAPLSPVPNFIFCQ